MDFSPGKFEKLKVASQFHFGPAQIDLPAGAEIEFDGITMKYAGKEYSGGLGLVGAYKAGWLVKTAAVATKYVPKPAGVQVRPASNAGQERGEAMDVEAVSEDEEVVGSLEKARAKRDGSLVSKAQPPKSEPKKVEAQKNRPTPRTPPAKKATGPTPFNKALQHEEGDVRAVKASVTDASSEIVDVDYDLDSAPAASSGDTLNEDAKPIAKLGNPRMKTTLTDASAAVSAIRDLDPVNGKPVRTQKLAAAKPPASKPTRPKANDDAEGGVPITQTQKNGATGDVEEARVGGDDLSDLLPDAATSGKPEATKFTWDAKTLHWRDRVKLAVSKYADKPSVLEQIYAVETDAVIKNIKSSIARL